MPVYQGVLNDAYYSANSAAEAVKTAKQNLDTANKRFLDESEIVRETTHNIELARIEKNEADQAVENLLMQDAANILPFAATPNPDGYEVAADGTLFIGSWKQFVRDFFGSTVKPYFNGDIQTLYSFTPGGLGSSVGSLADCQVEEERALSGFIIAVGNASFRVLVDGEVFTVNYGSCT